MPAGQPEAFWNPVPAFELMRLGWVVFDEAQAPRTTAPASTIRREDAPKRRLVQTLGTAVIREGEPNFKLVHPLILIVSHINLALGNQMFRHGRVR